MRPQCKSIRTRTIFGLALLAAALAPLNSGQAWTYKVLHSFCQQQGCADGEEGGTLIMDSAGNLYGAASGGAHHRGLVFVLTFNSNTGNWTYNILYDLCPRGRCSKNLYMGGIFAIDTNGDIYGVTQAVTKHSSSVFKLVPNSDRTKWSFHVLYQFCAGKDATCADGYDSTRLTYAGAAAGVLYDGKSPLYGTTLLGGGHDAGTAYQLSPPASGKPWQHTKLYDFCAQSACADGSVPEGRLALDDAGNLIGITRVGGQKNRGTIFELRPSGEQWTQQVLYNFCTMKACKDGQEPVSGVFIDPAGNLLGTNSNESGKCVNRLQNCGVVYKFGSNGRRAKLSVLYTFCSQPDCSDGKIPESEIVMNEQGTILGTTVEGGSANAGVLFALRDTYQVLHNFCSEADCTDGQYPHELLMDGAGNIFGDAGLGGDYGEGVIYELSP